LHLLPGINRDNALDRSREQRGSGIVYSSIEWGIVLEWVRSHAKYYEVQTDHVIGWVAIMPPPGSMAYVLTSYEGAGDELEALAERDGWRSKYSAVRVYGAHVDSAKQDRWWSQGRIAFAPGADTRDRAWLNAALAATPE
jgi:hypothetical protein